VAQTFSKFEAGAPISLLSLNRPSQFVRHRIDPGFIGFGPASGRRTEPGIGGRFTFNLTNYLAFEAEMNLFPRSDTNIARNEGTAAAPAGRVFQGQFGVKAGKRFRKFGIFAKARPGFVGFTEVTKLIGTTILGPFGVLNQTFTVGTFRSGKEAYFSPT